ncbi:MAG TPA: hypothetical protein P5107_07330 [Thermotogota bacterium]|nr:hypothetical protein [Thermotogota bacterium]
MNLKNKMILDRDILVPVVLYSTINTLDYLSEVDMTKIIISLCALLTVFVSFFLFSFSPYVYALIIAGGALAIIGSLRSDDVARTSLVALDLLFMLLIMVVYRNTLVPETMEFYVFFVAISLLIGGVEQVLFANKKMHPVLGLIFTVFFWIPLAVPIYFIVESKMGQTGGIAVLVVLFLIVVRDIFRRKKSSFSD